MCWMWWLVYWELVEDFDRGGGMEFDVLESKGIHKELRSHGEVTHIAGVEGQVLIKEMEGEM